MTTTVTRQYPGEDRTFMPPFVKALGGHTAALAATLPGKRTHQPASVWVYATVLIAWAEDHDLIPVRLRAEAELARKEHLRTGGTLADWIRAGVTDLTGHPGSACLADPRYLNLDQPPAEDALDALVDWWSTAAPDFVYADTSGPASITGWLAGDLLQQQDDEDRKAAALCQTPWWICDFLCERTLLPAMQTFHKELLRVCDPACGSGHILVWVLIGLYQWYRHQGIAPVPAVKRALAGLHGVELDPLTAAVARLRLTVVAGSLLASEGVLAAPLRLADIPADIRPRIAVGNSLLAGLDDPCPPGTILDDTDQYPGILTRGTYHAVIANPPYKVVKDPVVKDAIRRAYAPVAHGNFPLAVPFTVLLFELAIRGGHVAPGAEQVELFTAEHQARQRRHPPARDGRQRAPRAEAPALLFDDSA